MFLLHRVFSGSGYTAVLGRMNNTKIARRAQFHIGPPVRHSAIGDPPITHATNTLFRLWPAPTDDLMTLRLRCSTIRSNERFSKSLEINKRAFLVGTHKSTISSDIRRSRTPPLSCGPKTYHADRHRDHTPNNSRSPHAPAKRFRLSLVTSVAALLKASTARGISEGGRPISRLFSTNDVHCLRCTE